MSAAEVAERHYAAQLRQAEATLILVRRLWRRMSLDDLDGSWAGIVNRLTLIVAAAQLGAARAGAAYVPEALDEDIPADGEINPSRWAGVASDGRPLDSLLFGAVIHTRGSLGIGTAPTGALAAGGKWLDLLAHTQVADAGRGATGVGIAAREGVGYVRVISVPCCQRCAVLAGKFFKWNAGFQRHPLCDCRHAPSTRGVPAGFSKSINPDQIKDLTQAQRQAIADGGNVNQVINANRKRAAGGMTTTEGTTRRGVYGGYERMPDGTLRRRAKGERVPQRLTPDAIYRLASDRAEALDLLKRFGYLL